jgi:hypothetical protein
MQDRGPTGALPDREFHWRKVQNLHRARQFVQVDLPAARVGVSSPDSV